MSWTLLPHRAPAAQLVEHQAVMREVTGLNPGRINTQGLKITEEKVLPLEISAANGETFKSSQIRL